MISRLKLHNFYGHKDTSIDLHPNVNAIVGETDAGKTSILRGIYWVLFNRPSGNAMVSTWNRDKKGSQIKSTLASITIGKDRIARYKSKGKNAYKVVRGDREKVLEAIRSDVPDEVAAIANMGDVNIQRQMDSPFLVSQSPADVARYLNSLIRLDAIDNVLAGAENRRRQINRDISTADEEINGCARELWKSEWVDKASIIVARMEQAEGDISELTEKSNNISGMIASLKEAEEAVDRLAVVDIPAIELICASAEKALGKLRDMNNRLSGLASLVAEYREAYELDISCSYRIAEMEKRMPKICPLCGNRINK